MLQERENLQRGTGQELCDWNPCHPPQSINSNTPTQMMHENPFMLQAGSEDNTGEEGDTKDGLKDRCIYTGQNRTAEKGKFHSKSRQFTSSGHSKTHYLDWTVAAVAGV